MHGSQNKTTSVVVPNGTSDGTCPSRRQPLWPQGKCSACIRSTTESGGGGSTGALRMRLPEPGRAVAEVRVGGGSVETVAGMGYAASVARSVGFHVTHFQCSRSDRSAKPSS